MRFGTIIVDPPWPYQGTSSDRRLNGYSDKQYQPLSGEDLKNLSVGDVASEEAILFLWATAPFVPLALELVRGWGFDYVSMMFWLKSRRSPEGVDVDGAILSRPVEEGGPVLFRGDQGMAFSYRPAYGVGYWTRGNVEPIIIAKKPRAKSIRTGYRSLITRVSQHSEKPDLLHEMIEKKDFPTPRLELFARRPRDGWYQLGDELPEDGADIRESLPLLAQCAQPLAHPIPAKKKNRRSYTIPG